MKYVYKCNTCNYEFEKEVSMMKYKRPKYKCPHCKGVTRKIISYPTVIYRGEGFTLAKKES